MKTAPLINYFGLQTNNFSAPSQAQTMIICSSQNDQVAAQHNKQLCLDIAKNLTSISSFFLACLEIAFGFLQNTTISRIFALTSSAEATGAAALNLPHSDKIMAFVQFVIGSLITSEIVLPKKENASGSPILNKMARFSQEQFKNFATKANISESKLMNRMRFSLPILGLVMAVSKKIIAKNSTDSSAKEAFERSSLVDIVCFLESMLLFVPEKFERFFELPYKIGAGSKLLFDSMPALLGLTSVQHNKN